MAELKPLKIKRGQIKAQITRFNTFVVACTAQDAEELRERLKKIEETLEKFYNIQSAIETVRMQQAEKEKEKDAAIETVIQEEEEESREFENTYYKAVGSAARILDPVVLSQGIENINITDATQHTNVRLPTISLPTFDGQYSQWMLFKDAFISLINDNKSITDVQRFQYLRGSLRGEALQMIESLKTSAENYKIAWELLVNHYENIRLIINTHLRELFETSHITKDNRVSIRQFVNHIRSHLKSLQHFGLPIDKWDAILIYLVTSKLDYYTRKEWEIHIGNRHLDNLPTISELLEFLSEKYHMLEMIERAKAPEVTKGHGVKGPPSKRVTLTATTPVKCEFCKGSHFIFACSEFLKLSIQSRINEAKKLDLCLNCLRKGHRTKQCKSTLCKTCQGLHNTRLHLDTNASTSNAIPTENQISEKSPTAISAHCSRSMHGQVLLSTAQVYIYDPQGRSYLCRALLDPGSQSNIITKQLFERLRLPCKSINLPISGIQQNKIRAYKSTLIDISSKHNNVKYSLECLILPTITGSIPQKRVSASELTIPNNIQLADETYNTPGSIDLLIGAGLFWQLLNSNRIRLGPGQPHLQDTQLGWIIGGEIINSQDSPTTMCHLLTEADLNKQLEKFWQFEEVSRKDCYSPQERKCEEHFVETVSRNHEGRFIVCLPKNEDITLGNSKETALKRLYSLERRFSRQLGLKSDYDNFMKNYETLGHMSLLDTEEENFNSYYLPHHPVLKQDSITTKLRVVFDGSARTDSGHSLNDKLLVGPTIQDNLIDIILRFRMHQFVLTADIAMMYRQILVAEPDKHLQRILWRSSLDQPVQTFTLNTVTYGTSSAPFLAVRCLKELAKLEESSFPEAAQVLRTDFYVDDLITGTDSLEEACNLQIQLQLLLESGKFTLRKWRTNDTRILESTLTNDDTDDLLMLTKHEALKTLGLLWNATNDTLQYKVSTCDEVGSTKRSILSEISKIFDPLGLIGPILITAKLIMQKLWRQQSDWNAEVPDELHTHWITYHNSLSLINNLRIPRNVNPNNAEKQIELHGFSDASEKAYGACIYALSRSKDGNTSVNLICSKSRVAPLKSITLPRLELSATVLLSKLLAVTIQALKHKINKIHLWTDSTIVLSWIRTEPYKLKTFVSNRVSEIQNTTEQSIWRHVPSSYNPADLLSRGTSTHDLLNNDLWWHGPHWLPFPNQWPEPKHVIHSPIPEVKTSTIMLTSQSSVDILRRFSTFTKLQRVIAYCLRFFRRRKQSDLVGPLKVPELELSTIAIIRMVQAETMPSDATKLQNKKPLSRTSNLLTLRPFLDEHGLIRVGGRLRHADIPADQRHPIVLPSRHFVTTIIMRDEHIRLLHCGPEQLLNSIRQKFWPLSGRREARKITRKCISCFRFKPTTAEAEMGDLPRSRVEGFKRPFSTSGVDYAGPIQVRESRRRGRVHISKGYIAIFTCFSTKAVHLEMVSDLTTESFLAALRRFVARRGLCSQLNSDNATNFVGANHELQEIYKFLLKNNDNIATQVAQQQITWRFIPPRSPNFGGLWEAAVKATKRHLRTVTRNLILTFEEYSTLLSEIESVLNSRPLTPLSSQPNDPIALTPAHFLLGDSQFEPVQQPLLNTPDNHLSRWQHIQKVRQHFWVRWTREYLHQLQMRTKWYHNPEALKPGTMVLLMEDNTLPLRWPLGIIVEVHPGTDGITRVATVKTSSGTYKRTIRKLCALPLET